MGKRIRRKRKQARRHLPRRRTRIQLGVLIALAVVLAAAVLSALLSRAGGQPEVRALVDHTRSRQMDPVDLVVAAARTHRIVFLGDVHPATLPKRIFVQAIEEVARGPGLDAVVLEVPSDLQPQIDTYLESDPENVAHLLRHNSLLQEDWGGFHEYLEIYRRVWALNREFGPARRIRIVAADLPGWPPGPLTPLAVVAERFGQRDAHMAEVIDQQVLARNPRSRALIFMGGYHGLKGGEARLQVGGGNAVPVTWLATRLQRSHTGQVYTIVIDGARRPSSYGLAASYATTPVFEMFRRHLPESDSPFALIVDDRLDFILDPVQGARAPGFSLVIGDGTHRLQELVDGYIYLGTGSVRGRSH